MPAGRFRTRIRERCSYRSTAFSQNIIIANKTDSGFVRRTGLVLFSLPLRFDMVRGEVFRMP